MDYRIINIRTIPTDGLGSLSFLESSNDIPFEIKRIYYISGVPEGKERGFHAHKKLKQLLICPFGRIRIMLCNSSQREEIILDEPSKGLYVFGPLWREMYWEISASVLVVAASDYYTEDDYIRNYDDYVKFMGDLTR